MRSEKGSRPPSPGRPQVNEASSSRRDHYFKGVLGALQKAYEYDHLGNKADPLDELIYIVLSTRTRGEVFERMFDTLKSEFPEWKSALETSPEVLERLLRPGGLSNKKTQWLLRLLNEIQRREGDVDLQHLHSISDEAAEEYLISLPGIGLKTARCVMMYSLGRETFPVDANARRVLERLGALPSGIHYSKIHEAAQELVPTPYRSLLHVYFVIHGRATCKPRNPECESCPLLTYCDFGHERTAVDTGSV